MVLGWTGCDASGNAESAAQNARIDSLEQQVQQLRAALKTGAAGATAPSPAAGRHPFKTACPQPWVRQQPLGASLWTCSSPSAAPEGLFPQCSVTFQPQDAIETRGYFEFAQNAVPLLRAIKNVKDQRVKLRAADAFEATFETEPAQVPLRHLAVMVPHQENTYTIACSAPSASFGKYEPAFRQVIESFGFD